MANLLSGSESDRDGSVKWNFTRYEVPTGLADLGNVAQPKPVTELATMSAHCAVFEFN